MFSRDGAETSGNEGQRILIPKSQYTPEAISACEKALRTILSGIGPWGPRIVLMGGLAPRYLIQDLQEGIEPHLGTTDLDVVVGVVLSTDDISPYRTLAKNLKESGFHPLEASFRWAREIDGIQVVIEFFCPPEDGKPGSLKRNPAEGIGSAISAIRLRGAELAGEDILDVTLEGETLDYGGIRQVVVKVANILPFLTLKAFAIDDRTKEKDAYDIVWTLSAYKGGPAEAATAALQSPVYGHSDVNAAIELLRVHFSDIEAAGPLLYARFFLGTNADDDQRIRLRRYASGAVKEFLDAWDGRTF
jgi:hypothetical protein